MLYTHCPNFYDFNNALSYTNSSVNIRSNKTYLVDTLLGEVILILPANPEVGDKIILMDVNNSWNINNVTILNNTQKISSKLEDLVININNISLVFFYLGEYQGWSVILHHTVY